MRAIDRSEISAYLDGELGPARAAEIEAALAADPALAAEFAALEAADKAWREAASTAQFAPSVRLPEQTSFLGSWPGLAAIVIVLLALRFLPGLGSIGWGFAIHGVALALLAAWTVRSVAAASPAGAPYRTASGEDDLAHQRDSAHLPGTKS